MTEYTIQAYAGSVTGQSGYTPDGQTKDQTLMSTPTGIWYDVSNQRLYYVDSSNFIVRYVDQAGTVTTFAGIHGHQSPPSGDGIQATQYTFIFPVGIYGDASGNIYITDVGYNTVVRITNGTAYLYAGVTSGQSGFVPGPGPATTIPLAGPSSVWCSPTGDVYIVDSGNSVIRKVDSSGIMSVFAGNGSYGHGPYGGVATNASLNNPTGICGDQDRLYITEYSDLVSVSFSTGIITHMAGSQDGSTGYFGDGISASDPSVLFYWPNAVIGDGTGQLFIADSNNFVVRKIGIDGMIHTIAGNGLQGVGGDGGPAINASFILPLFLEYNMGILYISDYGSNNIRDIVSSYSPSYIILQFDNIVLGSPIQLPIQQITGGVTLTSSDGQTLVWSQSYPNNPPFYSTQSSVQLTITGFFQRFGSSDVWPGHEFLTEVVSWTDGVVSLEGAFRQCYALTQVPASLPTTVTNLSAAFAMGPVPAQPFVFPLCAFLGTGLPSWDTTLVRTMDYMLQGCNQFNQNIGSWNIGSCTSMTGLFDMTGLTSANYESTLVGWSEPFPTNIFLGAAGLISSNSWSMISKKNKLTIGYGWTFQESATKYYDLSYDILNLEYNHSYQAAVIASNSLGPSPISALSSPFTIQPSAPSPPSKPTVTSTPGNTTITVSWNPPSDLHGSTVQSYIVTVYPTPGSPYTINSPNTSLQVVVDYTSQYQFTVIAVSNYGDSLESVPSDPFTLNPSICDPPSKPTVQQVEPGTLDQRILVQWQAPANTHGNTINSYTVRVQTLDSLSYITTQDASTQLEIDNIAFNTPYTLSVRANTLDPTNNSFYSEPSDPFTIVKFYPYITPKRTETYPNISTAIRYSQYLSQNASSSDNNHLPNG